jgi:DNA mismatch repair protein MutS
MTKPVKMTPMLRQYMEIKEQYSDAILFYRMGDFYEMFLDDAVTASKILGITLTSRSAKDAANKIPMCGVPYHALSGYLSKMIKAGFRVALCEQVEDPKEAKGIVRREVVRVVTPGVTTDDQLLDEKSNTFVCALCLDGRTKKNITAGLAFLDVSTGNFLISESSCTRENFDSILDDLTRMQPAEILIAERDREILQPLLDLVTTLLGNLCLTQRSDLHFDRNTATSTLTEHFNTTGLAGFGCEHMPAGIRAGGALLGYIEETQKTDLSYIKKISPLNKSGYLIIDESSRRNLELTETIIGGKREGSLLAVLDLTSTPMGARFLRQQLLFPLQDRDTIISRLGSIESLLADVSLQQNIRQILTDIYDIERLCSRLVLGQGNARDMNSLGVSLARLPDLKKLLESMPPGLLQQLGLKLDPLADLYQLITRAIRDDAPVTLREGNLIKEGFHAELDELIVLLRDGKQLIANLEGRERKRSGNPKLKVGFNKVFGYFFEVSRAQAATIPEDYIRKQTLVNAERFISPELKELENKISSAHAKRLELEYQLFFDIRRQINVQSERLLQTAAGIARVDFLTTLAGAAEKYHYTRPTINTSQHITIEEGRHPVIERTLEPGRFVPNDVHLDQNKHELLIITGPNMAGKSTVLRQTALIVLMAHIGSFVPADRADLCIVDRIFTRVGAMDDLRRGQSTFMVEMNETANILNNATEQSLVILDEIGRGTSTYDGLSIAWAVAEELANKNKLGIKTLFATHYHELTDLAATHKRIQNYSIAVREWQDSIIFLHKLVKGATNRSYGIQVAGLAGVPPHVVKRAHNILKNIEEGEFNRQGQPVTSAGQQHHPYQLSLFHQDNNKPLQDLLAGVDVNNTTPLEALQILHDAKNLLKGD